MVVEDDAVLSQMACDMVEECGLKAFCCDRGDAAYAHLAIHADAVAALFVDIGLRDTIDGIALAITASADHPWIRICVPSGQTQARPDELPTSIRFLPKPWRALEVLDFVLPS